MPSVAPAKPRAGSNEPDELDRYFNEYDEAVNDFLKDLPLDKDNQANNSTGAEATKNIDEEIKVKKQRNPVPKLDENRLLSHEGIPRLRKITKTRLKFRGKGHEFSDISRLLNTYQLWLDDLYPRAKFRDALDLVELVGHKKRMQVMRKAWIDGTKPYRRDDTPPPEESDGVEMSGVLPTPRAEEGAGNAANVAEGGISAAGQTTLDRNTFGASDGDAPDDDELDALLAENSTTPPVQAPTATARSRGPFQEDDDIDDDELDALVAEEPLDKSNGGQPSSSTTGDRSDTQANQKEDDFADEEEIMADMDLW